MPASEPAVSVIVVNYNGGHWLQGCLASLAAQTFRDFETIVVDNASTDDSLDRLTARPPGLVILRQSANLGFAGGNNVAARSARGQWIALLNPDAEAAPDWIARMLAAVAARPRHRMVASLQLMLGNETVLDGAGDCYSAWGYAWRGGHRKPAATAPAAGVCFAPCGAAALYPRDAFLAAGGFDERYFCYHEDVDLGFRLRLMGESCQFDPSCVVRHAGSAIAGKASAFAIFHGMRNGVWTWLKNMPLPLLIVGAPVWAAGALALLVRGAMIGRLRDTCRGLAAGLAGAGEALAQRRALKRLRTARLGEIARALTWNPLAYVRRSIDVRPFPGKADQ